MINLPFPSRALSPNARVSRWRLAGARKADKEAAFWTATQAVRSGAATLPRGDRWALEWAVTEPMRGRGFDDDNLTAMLKAYRDGIAMAFKVDDARFTTRLKRAGKSGAGFVVARLVPLTPGE